LFRQVLENIYMKKINISIVILSALLIIGCQSVPDNSYTYHDESNDSIEREDEIMRQQPVIKPRTKKEIDRNNVEESLNDSVIEEDTIMKQQPVIKKKEKRTIDENADEEPLNDRVIEEDPLIKMTRPKNKSKKKYKLQNYQEETNLNDAIDGDQLEDEIDENHR